MLAIAEGRERRRAEHAIERSERVLDKARARIERLATRQWYMMLLGPVGLLLGFAAGAF